jgi:Leucine-rich repeat (LRR) protein
VCKSIQELLDRNANYLRLKRELKNKGGPNENPTLFSELLDIEIKEPPKTRINFSYFPIGSIPSSAVVKFTNIAELYLYRSDLSALPPEVAQIAQLRILDLNTNNFTTLPACVSSLTLLQELDLGYNQLAFAVGAQVVATLRPAASSAGNNVRVMGGARRMQPDHSAPDATAPAQPQPDETLLDLSRHQNITCLSLTHNNLKEIPVNVFQLKHLERLDVSFNQIAAVPAAIAGLSQLKNLSLQNNVLASLPIEIGQIAPLEELWLDVRYTSWKIVFSPFKCRIISWNFCLSLFVG